MKVGLCGIAILCAGVVVAAISDTATMTVIDYMGQAPPGLEPRIFAHGFISTSAPELNSVFSPDGDLFLFTRRDRAETYRIMETRGGPEGWSPPSVTPFTGEQGGVDPAFSWDGSRIFFGSSRPGTLGDADIWEVELSPDGRWGEPRNLGGPINTPGNENHASPARDGTLYFHSGGHPGLGESDIFRAAVAGEGYAIPVNLGPEVNSEAVEFDPFVAPDQSFLVFASNREGGYGRGDLHVSFRTDDGGWTRAVNLGDAINTSATEFCPKVTPDGKYLFYTSRSTGEGDVYWVDARIIEKHRPGAP